MEAAFRCRLGEFDSTTALEKLGSLISAAAASGFATHQTKQIDAWQAELNILQRTAVDLLRVFPSSREWWLLFEFEIPRRGKRPDLILLADDLIFVIEFKIGSSSFAGADEWQASSYALDLRDFHLGSHGRRIIPVLVATGVVANRGECVRSEALPSVLVHPIERVADSEGHQLAARLNELYSNCHDLAAERIDGALWEQSAYRPTPTIIEAAEQLFAGHSVADISHAFATNLDITSAALLRAIQHSQTERRRTICFVTGIPGAGKTLTGLSAVHDPAMRREGRPAAVFLSGNGPLVRIVREALIRDRQRAAMTRQDAARTVSTFIDNVHRFITTYGIRRPDQPPYENAIVFDEAQRAWDATAVNKKHRVAKSEPGLVLEVMERAPDWATIIALIGGGQEIHRGEAGLAEWGRALNQRSVQWRVLVSPEALRGGSSVAGHRLFDTSPGQHLEVVEVPELHLDVSVRSPRARRIADWVNAILHQRDGSVEPKAIVSPEFPIVVTRELDAARQWLRVRSEGKQRCGLLASSGALRLRAHGIEVSSGFRRGFQYEDWFLSGLEDTRSSMWLEVAASEFECQGLDLDWTGICWAGDLVIDPPTGRWMGRRFRGTKWERVRRAGDLQFLVNKYRVLLTRARRGVVIWVPRGDTSDPTREPQLFDATADYLCRSGVPAL